MTGISTGALVAPFAFLGLQYDAELERFYTSLRRENIFRPRLLWLDSVASSEPLEQQIAAGATLQIIQELAAAHRQGRRLYVGTTNLDTKRLVVWDMGAITALIPAESRSLFQKVLLASCSVPVCCHRCPSTLTSTKAIRSYMWTEVCTACVFLQPGMIGIGPNAEVQTESSGPVSVHVIVAGNWTE